MIKKTALTKEDVSINRSSEKKKLSLEIEEKHILVTRRAKYSCTVCGNKFTTFSDLTKHRDAHDNVNIDKSDDDVDPYDDDDEGSWRDDDEDVDKSEGTDDEVEPLTNKEQINNKVIADEDNDVILVDYASTSDLTCNWCLDDFDNEEDLRAHVQLHSTLSVIKPEATQDTHDSLDNIPSLTKKKESTGLKKIHPQALCFYCPELKLTMKHLSTHFKLKKGAMYSCHFCQQVIKSGRNFMRHIKVMHAKQCYLCRDKYSSRKDLIIHLEASHGANKQVSPKETSKNKPADLCFYCSEPQQSIKHLSTHFDVTKGKGYSCYFCVKETQRSDKLLVHIRARHAMECYLCKTKFSSRTNLISHLEAMHGREGVKESFRLCFYCDESNRSTKHLSTHFEVKKGALFTCHFCALEFTDSFTLSNHIAELHDKECYVCKMKFDNRGDLISHLNEKHKSGQDEKQVDSGVVSCFYCPEPNLTMKHLSTHFKLKKGETYNCHFCGQILKYFSVLRRHITVKHAKQCYLCREKFSSRKDLIAHLKAPHAVIKDDAKDSHLCFYCDKLDRSAKHISSHFNVKEGAPYACPFCSFTSTYGSTFPNHIAKHHQKECYVCKMKFAKRVDLISHLNADDHLKEGKPVNADEQEERGLCFYCPEPKLSVEHLSTHFNVTESKRFFCLFCSKTIGMKSRFMAHIRSSHSKDCYRCTEKFASRSSLLSHLQEKHEGELYVSKVPTFKYCTFCNKIIDEDLKVHKETEHTKQCTLCLKVFKTPHTFTSHMRYVHSTEPLRCNECGIKLTTMAGLRKHMKLHGPLGDQERECRKEKNRNIPRTQCPICNKMVKSMIIHKKRHNAKECVVCNICGKSVKAIDIKNHESYEHKPSKCPICNKEYKGRRLMLACRSKHTRRFKCDDCGRDFLYSASLIVHRRLHTGEKPYPCTVCDRRFYTNQILYKHMLSHGVDTKGNRTRTKTTATC